MPDQHPIKLKLIPVELLLPHEETVPHLYEKLSRRMMHDGVQRDPIIVDEKTNLVLDGMHRLQALKRMGARSAVCSVVDYMSDSVQLFRWFRFVENPSQDLVMDVLSALKASEEVPLTGDARFQEKTAVFHRGRTYISRVGSGVEAVIEATRMFDRLVKDAGILIEFFDESAASPELLGGKYMALLIPRFNKEDVVRAGTEGKLLPPKTTLHVLPARPMGVNYPIESLRAQDDILERILATRQTKTIEPPSFYRGRLYREPVVVFE